MKDVVLYFLLLVLIGEVAYLFIQKARPQEKVLAETSATSPMPSASPEPTPIESPTPLPTPSPTPKPSAVETPPTPKQIYSSEQINGFIDRFAGQYAVDPNVLRHIAICESGFNPLAYRAGYAGLYQFGSATWKNLRVKIGENTNPDLRFDAEEAAQTAAYALSIGDKVIWPNCQP
jgi:hypothetical protein